MAPVARTVALDWSGTTSGQGKTGTWTAEAAGGRLTDLTNGRTRDEATAHLIELAQSCPDLVVGLDFSFSMPAWFQIQEGVDSIDQLWELVADEGERWLAECPRPFFGAAGTKRPVDVELFRACEHAVVTAGARPKSVFQIAGSGQVGPGSLRGMPLLPRLREAGFSIWPFDAVRSGHPVAVEIYPRLLTGPVNKRDVISRAAAVTPLATRMDRDLALRAAGSEDSFDAALCALAMDDRRAELRALSDPGGDAALEGAIWR